MDIELLKKTHPELVKQIVESAVAESRAETLKIFETKLIEKESELRAEILEQVRAENTASGTDENIEALRTEIATLKTECESLKKDKQLLVESAAGGSKDLLESLSTTVAQLKTDLSARDVKEWLTERTKSHPSGAAILKRCSAAKTVTEAEKLFKDATDLLEDVAKQAAAAAELGKTTVASGKGEVLPPVEEKTESVPSTSPEKLPSKSKAQLLAGV